MVTVRTGEQVPDGLSALWRSDEVRRLDLVDLSREDVDTLLHLALGGPLEGRATTQLWEATQGNPLFLHELVAAARQSGALHQGEAQADALEARGGRRPEDALRIAMWRLDAGVGADPDLLLRAARLARHAHDYEQVARLAAAAADAAPSADASLLFGEACYELGRFEEAEEALATASDLCTDDDQRLLVAAARQTNLFWGLLEPERAVEVIRAAREAVSSDEAAAALVSAEASTTMYGGRPDQTLELLAGMSEASPRARVLRAIPEAPALALAGRTGEAIAVAERGLEEHMGLEDEIAIAHFGTHIATRVLALGEAGRFAEGVELAQAGYQVAVADWIIVGQIWFSLNLSRIALLQGRPRTAERWAREGCAVARTRGFTGPLRMALSALSVALAWQGDAQGAADTVQESDAMSGRFDFMRPERGLGRAWACAVAGQLPEARRHLLVSADEAEQTGHLTVATWLLHEVARLGEAMTVRDRLAGLADRCDSALVAARSQHVTALANGDAAGLVAASEAFEAIGAMLVAAEAAISAADALRRSGDQRAAAAQATRAERLRAQCEGAIAPGLVATDTVVPLTGREREIALLAAAGVTSKDIADRLYLSVRTVNNHLQHVYTKLGVASRAELADALGVDAAG